MITPQRLSAVALTALCALALVASGCGDDASNSAPADNSSTNGQTSTNGGTTSTNGQTTSTNGGTTSTNGGTTSTNGGTTSTNGGTTSTNGGTTSTNGQTTGPPTELRGACDGTSADRSGFNVYEERGSIEGLGPQYIALNAADTPYDALLVQLFTDYDAPTEPGTYSLDGINYRDCGLCVLALSECGEDGCAKTFYAEQGEVEITKLSGAGEDFAATLKNVVFDEVTIDDQFVSTPVAGGETWCMNDYAFDEELVDFSAAACAQDDINCVGETVPDFSLANCDQGDMVSMSELAEGKKAIWVVLTAGWCSACRQWVPQVVEYDNDLDAAGLEVVYILGEDSNYGRPSRGYCQQYASTYGEGLQDRFFLDHDGEASFATTFSNMWPYIDAQGLFGLPWNAVIDPETMEFVYADGSGQPETLDEVINDLLAR